MKLPVPRDRIHDAGRNIRRWVCIAQWSYASIVGLALALLWFTGDTWWLGTLLCFGPRWLLLAPAPILIGLCFACRRIRWLPTIAIFVFAPFWLGFVVPAFSRGPLPTGAIRIRIATFNALKSAADFQAFVRWVESEGVDVLIVQESRIEDLRGLLGPQWHFRSGERAMIVASRHPIVDAASLGWHDPVIRGECTAVQIAIGETIVRVGGVHLATPRQGLESLMRGDPNSIRQIAEEREGRRRMAKEASLFLLQVHNVDFLAGDFNMPVESHIYHEFWGEPTNAFSTAGCGLGYTKRTSWHGVRIDHILVANGEIGVVNAHVGPAFRSDHCSVIAELSLPSK